MECSTVTCVVRLLGTRKLLQVHSRLEDAPSIHPMLRGSPSPMEVLGSIYGHWQLVSAKITATEDGTALAPNTQGIPHHHLWAMIITAKQAGMGLQEGGPTGTLIPYGMAKAALLGTTVAPMLECPGSERSCHSQRMITSRLVFAVMNLLQMRISQWSSLSCISNDSVNLAHTFSKLDQDFASLVSCITQYMNSCSFL